MCSRSLPIHDVSEMGRRFSSVRAFPGFGMKVISACFHSDGRTPVLHTLLKYDVRAETEASSRFLRILYVTPSSPGALLRVRPVSIPLTSFKICPDPADGLLLHGDMGGSLVWGRMRCNVPLGTPTRRSPRCVPFDEQVLL